MKDRLTKLIGLLQQTTFGTKVTLLVCLFGLFGIVGVTTWRASIPHFVLLRSELSDLEAAACEAALAGAGIRYEISQPPGPYVIRVDEPKKYEALNAIANAGALIPGARGVSTESTGASSVFKTAQEREQMVAKQEWEECEKQLEALDYISRACVTASHKSSTVFKPTQDRTVSVVVTVKGRRALTFAEGDSIAHVVGARFGIPKQQVVVADQSGRIAWGGGETDEGGGLGLALLKHKQKQDEYLLTRIQNYFDRSYGPGLIQVEVDTEWSYDRVETFDNTPSARGVTVSKETRESSSPAGKGVGGAVGFSNTAQDFGNSNAAIPQPGNAAPGNATTKDSSERSVVGTRLEHRIQNEPVQKDVRIALLIDQSLGSSQEKIDEIEAIAASFVPSGLTSTKSVTSAVASLASVERDEEGNPLPLEKPLPEEEPNELMAMALEYGVEAIAALAFLLVLLKSLKTARSAVSEALQGGPAGPDGPTDEIDPELAARMQIEALLDSEPERVGKILSAWAASEEATVGAEK